jgi:NADH-quinone oxidoreductase subunit A
MRTGYVPVVILAVLSGAFAVLSLMVSALLRPKRPTPAKVAPYESGITPIRLPKAERFPVKFYVVAMLFIIFDIEAIFLYPWAVAFRQLGLFGLVEMVVFIGLVFVAYVYVWQKGGLEWEALERRTAPGQEGFEPLPATVERGPGEGVLASASAVDADESVSEAGRRAPVGAIGGGTEAGGR